MWRSLGPHADDSEDYEGSRVGPYLSPSGPSLRQRQREFDAAMEFKEWEVDEFFLLMRGMFQRRLDKDVGKRIAKQEGENGDMLRQTLHIVTIARENTGA